MFLFNDLIVLASKPKRLTLSFSNTPSNSEYKFIDQLKLKNLKVGILPPETDEVKHSFFLQYEGFIPDRFYCDSEEEAKKWVKILKDAINDDMNRNSIFSNQNSFSDSSLLLPDVPSIIHPVKEIIPDNTTDKMELIRSIVEKIEKLFSIGTKESKICNQHCNYIMEILNQIEIDLNNNITQSTCNHTETLKEIKEELETGKTKLKELFICCMKIQSEDMSIVKQKVKVIFTNNIIYLDLFY